MYQLGKCIHPLLKKRESQLIARNLQAAMEQAGMEFLILHDDYDIFYATGYQPLLGNAISVVPAKGDPIFITSTLESTDVYCNTENVDIREVASFVFIDDGSELSHMDKGDVVDPDALTNMVFNIVLKHPISGKVGVVFKSIGQRFWSKLISKIPESLIVDAQPLLEKVRVIKTPWEIEMLRNAAQYLEKAWNMVAVDIKAGMPAWKVKALFMYHTAALNLDVGTMSREGYFMPGTGPYFGLCGMPRGYILKEGDIVKFDAGYRFLGYNADIARTFAVGEKVSDAAGELYDVLYRANRLGVKMLRPGVKCSEIYKAVRADVEKSRLIPKYPRGYIGHSVGCSSLINENPTIASTTDVVLQENMVFCLETPYSGTGNAPIAGGFNLEDTHLITAAGHESFTEVPKNIFWN